MSKKRSKTLRESPDLDSIQNIRASSMDKQTSKEMIEGNPQ